MVRRHFFDKKFNLEDTYSTDFVFISLKYSGTSLHLSLFSLKVFTFGFYTFWQETRKKIYQTLLVWLHTWFLQDSIEETASPEENKGW